MLLTGEGFEPPTAIPSWGLVERKPPADPTLPKVGILFYRAHHASGNTTFANDLADAVDATGQAIGVPVFAGSLRSAPDDLFDALGDLDALVVTVLAAGGSVPASVSAGGDDETWDVERIAALDIPVLQGLCLTSSREEWEANDDGVTPLDSANQIAIPEFDGRIITAPFSFKEIDTDGLPATWPTRSVAAGSPPLPSTTPGSGTCRTRRRRSRSSSPPIPPSTRGSATRSASTPRCRRSGCFADSATRATTWVPLAPSRASTSTTTPRPATPSSTR